MFMKNINQQFRFDIKSRIRSISFNNVEVVVINFQNIKKKLLIQYHDDFNVFDRA